MPMAIPTGRKDEYSGSSKIPTPSGGAEWIDVISIAIFEVLNDKASKL
jgi:hypothetical protein